MLFRGLINAIEKLVDSNLVLAKAFRDYLDISFPPGYDEQEQFQKILAKIRAEQGDHRESSELAPMGSVFYASEDASERQSYSEEIEQYLRDRGYSPEAVDSVKGLVGK